MFYYRAIGELSREKWASILDESFILFLPITPYRLFPISEVINGRREVRGIDAVIEDTASLYAMSQGIVKSNNPSHILRRHYYCGHDEIIVSGDHVMCRSDLKL